MTRAAGDRAAFRQFKVQPQAVVVDGLGLTTVPSATQGSGDAFSSNSELSARPGGDDAGGGGSGDTEAAVVRGAFLKAFLLSMAAFGLFHPMRFRNVGAKWWPILMAYSLCCLGLLAANVIRMSATMFQANDATMQSNPVDFLMKVAGYGWQLSVLLVAALLFAKNCARDKGFARYYGRLNAMTGKLEAAGMRPDRDASRRVAALCLAVGWALVFANAAYGVVYVFSSLKGSEKSAIRWRAEGDSTESEYEAVAYFDIVATVYGAGAMVFPVVYVLVICLQMCSLWSCFNAGLDRATASHPEKVLTRIGDYRRLYGEVCEVVCSANDCVEHLVGVHMCFNFALTMMQAYLIATSSADEYWPSLRIGVAIWLASGLGVMVTEFGAGCIVIDKAHECGEYLERIPYTRGSEADCEHLAQLQLFINQIKRDRGFTIFGIYPITRESLLPMVGTWITYLLILTQSPANTSPTAAVGAVANNSANMSSLVSG